MMKVQLHGHGTIEIELGATALDLAKQVGKTGPSQALAAQINGVDRDLFTPLNEGDEIVLWTFDDAKGKEIYWHTSAHVLAQAVLRLFPEAKPSIGPPINQGFYYDFGNVTITDEDLPKIEKEMKKIAKEGFYSKREEIASKKAAIEAFKDNPYKVELIEGFEEGSALSAYRQGEFYDLCRGPHLPNVGKIKAIKVMKTAGAYWRGDSDREMLTRIYAITFPAKELLADYLHMLAEAKKRDHKIIGPKLGLFSLNEAAPGMPFIHPKGMIIWNRLIDYWRHLHNTNGYVEIKTPMMMTRELWEISGHWDHYRDNMYTSQIEKREWAIKPMNCPGCLLYYKTQLHSYRELPIRIGEIGHVHRYEASGALSGLFRVRSFHQDDAHIFVNHKTIGSEIKGVLDLAEKLYAAFGLEYHFELSTRPEKDTIGSDEDWEVATQALQEALEETKRPFILNPGDGAFYGPKIDIHMKDALGRAWQCGTIQVDLALPEKFQLEYTDADGVRKRPIIIHRALYGSLERFLGSLIEFYAGKFPLWLSPRQVRIVTVADRHADWANEIAAKARALGFECEVDDSNESVGKKVRNAQLDQVNYMLTVGDKEVENKSATLRTRDNVVHGELNLDDFLAKIVQERDNRSLQPSY